MCRLMIILVFPNYNYFMMHKLITRTALGQTMPRRRLIKSVPDMHKKKQKSAAVIFEVSDGLSVVEHALAARECSPARAIELDSGR